MPSTVGLDQLTEKYIRISTKLVHNRDEDSQIKMVFRQLQYTFTYNDQLL
jgi:hypothetical protein